MLIPEPDDRMTVAQAAHRLGVSVKSVRRWMRTGIGVGGRTVRLGSLKVGHARITCRAWVDQFLAAQNPNPPGPDAESPIHSPAELRRAAAKARKELAGIIGR